MEIGLFCLGAIIGWLTSHFYYRKSTRDLKAELAKLKDALRPRTSLKDFETILDSEEWQQEIIDDKNVWIYQPDNSFQIVQGESDIGEQFTETWTKNFPDQRHSGRCPVYLRISGSTVKEIAFVSLDGGRVLVPMPDVRVEGRKQVFYWRASSLEFKLGKLIGRFYIHNTMFGVANFCHVAVEGTEARILRR